MNRCPENLKQEILTKYICGDTPKELSKEFGIHVTTIYRWINIWKKDLAEHALAELPIQDMSKVLEYAKSLKQQLEEAEQSLVIVHESGVLQTIPLKERLNMAMSLAETYPAKLLCRTFEISQSTFYHYRKNKGDEIGHQQRDCDISNAIRSVFVESGGRLGSRRVQMMLHRKGIKVGKRKVSKIMRQMGLSMNQDTVSYYSPSCMLHMEEVDDVKIL